MRLEAEPCPHANRVQSVEREREMDGVTFLRRQEGKGSREWDPFFRKIKNVCSGPSRWEEEGMSEDANM